MTSEQEAPPAGDLEPVTMMEHFVSLPYSELLSPFTVRYCEQLLEGRIIGHRCPSCGLVYIPPRGYCPVCTVETTESDEVVAPDRGVVSGYTIVTPVRYYGQKETEPFVRASIMLDDVRATLGLQDILEVPHHEVRAGMRVSAAWVPPPDRNVDGITNRSWGSVEGCILGWLPTGEPDMAPKEYEEARP